MSAESRLRRRIGGGSRVSRHDRLDWLDWLSRIGVSGRLLGQRRELREEVAQVGPLNLDLSHIHALAPLLVQVAQRLDVREERAQRLNAAEAARTLLRGEGVGGWLSGRLGRLSGRLSRLLRVRWLLLLGQLRLLLRRNLSLVFLLLIPMLALEPRLLILALALILLGRLLLILLL